MTPDFNTYNPYGYLDEIPGWEKMTDEERDVATRTHLLFGCATYAIGFAIVLLLCFLFCGCTTTKYVPVTETHTEHHWHTDTVRQTDSIIDRQTTLIREVDSATMAQYGIQLKDMQRAWLIQNDRLQRELSRLRESKTDTVVIRDSIPYPVEVIKEVERKPSKTELGLMIAGVLSLIAVIIYAANKLKRFLP